LLFDHHHLGVQHTQTSLLLAILVHGFINFTQLATSFLFSAAAFNETGPVSAFVLLALVILIAIRGSLGYSRPQGVAP